MGWRKVTDLCAFYLNVSLMEPTALGTFLHILLGPGV